MNADLVGAFDILKKVKRITPSLPGLTMGRGNWGKALPEGFEKPLSRVILVRTPQTFPSLVSD
ncbi:MAG TPA: transposase [Thermococcus sp.]|nr:MAG: transposase [Thermococci archaeon]RLF79968.1 MAG: transposase [Thermococci archaeon]RLF84078.1 MAG: transposase [Thermococci archaeon]RLF86776.1 MAG: transposase [Thermococci archaeon]HDH44290.1 transposase [Thermococcus sp.]